MPPSRQCPGSRQSRQWSEQLILRQLGRTRCILLPNWETSSLSVVSTTVLATAWYYSALFRICFFSFNSHAQITCDFRTAILRNFAVTALGGEYFQTIYPSKLGSCFAVLPNVMAAQAALPPLPSPCTSGRASHVAEPYTLLAELNTVSYKGESDEDASPWIMTEKRGRKKRKLHLTFPLVRFSRIHVFQQLPLSNQILLLLVQESRRCEAFCCPAAEEPSRRPETPPETGLLHPQLRRVRDSCLNSAIHEMLFVFIPLYPPSCGI